MKRVDVAVVGASAAGLRAAWAAAQAGARVALLESRSEIGVPAAPAALGFDFLWPERVRPPESATLRRYRGVRLASPGGSALDVGAPARFFDRAALDRHLAREAERAGSELALGVRGLGVAADRTLSWDSGALAASVVVFADGASTLARRFLAPVERPDRVAWGAALEVDAPGAESEEWARLTVGSHAPGGRSQLNPVRGSRWVHWTFWRGRVEEAEARARRALALDAARLGFPAGVAERARFAGVAPDPVAALPRELASDGVLVAGGAAGQGGLEVGLASGEMAGGEAALAAIAGDASRERLLGYERAWRARYLAGYRALARATDRLARLDDAAIDRALAPWGGRRVEAARLVALEHGSLVRRAAAAAWLARENPRALPALAAALARVPLSFSARAPSRRAE